MASHRTPDAVNDINAIKNTIAYLEDANRFLAENPSTMEFIQMMMAAYPTYKNPTTLFVGAASRGLEDA